MHGLPDLPNEVSGDLAGAYSAGSYASVTFRQPGLGDGVLSLMDEKEGSVVSDLESSDWPFDGMSCHAPATLQHRDTGRPAMSSMAQVDTKQYLEVTEIGDSAWEMMQHEKHMRRCSDSSGSVMYDTSFIRHVGDRLFDSLAK